MKSRQEFCLYCGTSLQISAATPSVPEDVVSLGIEAYAGFWRRFAAWIIDQVLLGIVGSVIGFAIGLGFGASGSRDTGAQIMGCMAGVVIGWLYYALMESSSNQATLDKMALGIKVTDLNGNRISIGRATGGYFAKIISSAILLIGYIMIGFTEKKQGFHDMIAGTLVVKKK